MEMPLMYNDFIYIFRDKRHAAQVRDRFVSKGLVLLGETGITSR